MNFYIQSKKITIFSSILAFLLIAQNYTGVMVAESNSIYFSQTELSAQKNDIITVKVKTNTPTDFNAAQIDITYDPLYLQYQSYSLNSPALPTVFNVIDSNGTVGSTLYIGGGQNANGNNLNLISFSFKALKETNGTNITFNNSTAVVAAGATVSRPSNQVRVSIGSSDASSSSSNNSTNSINKPQVQSPVINNQPPSSFGSIASYNGEIPDVTNQTILAPKILSTAVMGFKDSVINVKVVTDMPTRGIVSYGELAKQTDNQFSQNFSTEYFIPLAEITNTYDVSKDYYYTVTAVNQEGGSSKTEAIKFSIKPVNVTLKLQDTNGSPIQNTEVIVNGVSFTSDASGSVRVENILPGKAAISFRINDEMKYIGDATIVEDVSNQEIIVSPDGIKEATITANKTLLFGAIFGTFVIISGLVWLFYRKRYSFINKKDTSSQGFHTHSQTSQFAGPTKDFTPQIITPTNMPTSPSVQNSNPTEQDINEAANRIINNK